MNPKSIRKLLLAGVVVAVLLLAFGLVGRPGTPAKGNNVFALQAPPFVGVALANTDSITSTIEDEAGISAYFQASTSINLSSVRSVFRTIEAETADYIIGSVPVANYPESEDVHVYVHKDGWILAYYLAADPVGKIFDWKSYNGGTSISTKLEKTITVIADEVGISFMGATYYDFRYPNANRMMLIAEALDSGGNEFTVKLPSSFVYYERSWGLYNTEANGGWVLDGRQIASLGWNCWCTSQGFLAANDLSLDTTHTISVDDCGGLALVYRIP